MIKTRTKVYETSGAVLKAETIGFYKIKGLARKSGRCRHISCGATKSRDCYYFAELAEHETRLLTGKYYGNVAYDATHQAWAIQRLNAMKPQHANCTKDWCVPNTGKQRPVDLGQMVACSRNHLQPYTEAEMADPNVRPESIALDMIISLKGAYQGTQDRAIGLYDLIDDKWFNDQWWTRVGYKNENLMPHGNNSYWPAPKELVNITQVIDAVKAGL